LLSIIGSESTSRILRPPRMLERNADLHLPQLFPLGSSCFHQVYIPFMNLVRTTLSTTSSLPIGWSLAEMFRTMLLTLAALVLLNSTKAQSSPPGYQCKCAPGEACWPAAAQWSELNTTVGGNLVVNVPPGAACYASLNGASTYDQAKCSEATQKWGDQQWQFVIYLVY
jgi:hypothetical protein